MRIEPQEKPGGNEPVFTSVNGVNILIPRAQTCWVDYKYYHALQNAVAHIAEVDRGLQHHRLSQGAGISDVGVHVEPPLTKAEKKRRRG